MNQAESVTVTIKGSEVQLPWDELPIVAQQYEALVNKKIEEAEGMGHADTFDVLRVAALLLAKELVKAREGAALDRKQTEDRLDRLILTLDEAMRRADSSIVSAARQEMPDEHAARGRTARVAEESIVGSV